MYPESRIRVSRLLMSPFLNNNSHCGLEPRMSCSHMSALPQKSPFICRARVLGQGWVFLPELSAVLKSHQKSPLADHW